MYIIKQLATIINILSVIVLLIGLVYDFKRPKIKAVYGYTIAGCMILYIISLFIVSVYSLVVNLNFYGLILLLCIISPFIIGKFVKFETLKKYTVIQILAFALSLLTLILRI